jgi:hypothetical protein
MPNNLNQTGVMQVDGAWATSVKYAVDALGPNAGSVDLRFMQGRTEVAKVSLPREKLGEVIGDRNRTAIERHIANDADKYLPTVSGELKGRRLYYQEVTLGASKSPPVENSIAPTPTRDRTAETALRPAREPSRDSAPPGGLGSQDAKRADAHERAADFKVAPVPAHIAAKYLVKGDNYHFDDQTVAFIDKGTQLTAKTHNRAIIEDLVAIAKARDWQEVTVSGTQKFRREAWKAATAAGLTVTGYRPSEIERAAMERERGQREEPIAPAASAWEAERPSVTTSKGVSYGTLVDHGEAPFRHDATQSMSYFVTLRDSDGRERTSWGVGLKDAIQKSETNPAVNDLVGIRRAGSTAVTVAARSVDEDGVLVTQAVDAKRYDWKVEKAEYFTGRSGTPSPHQSPSPTLGEKTAGTDKRSQEPGSTAITREQEAAAAIRSAATTREELQLKYPELNKAVFQHLASHEQFADAYVKYGLIRESDRAQVIAQMRDRLASKLEQGAVLREPDNKEVSTLIRRSVHRVAADIGRPPIEIQPRTLEPPPARAAIVREDAQVR